MFAKVSVLFALVAFAHAGVLNAGYGLGYGAAAIATPVYRQAPALAYAAAAPALVAHAAPVLAGPTIVKQAVAVEAPQPYDFGYSVHNDDGSSSNRHETSDANNAKTGSYGYTSPDGIYRQVDYVADALGFRATIKTNEHGTAPQSPAAVQLLAEEPPYKVLPAAAPIVKTVGVAHAPLIAKAAIAAPVYAHAAPVYAHAAPAYAHAAYAAPAYGYASAPVIKAAVPSYGYAAPAYGYAAGPTSQVVKTVSGPSGVYGTSYIH